MTGPSDPSAVVRSVRWYETVVRLLYPKDFRDPYAVEMRLLFTQLARDGYRHRGLTGLARVWLHELPAIIVGASSERSTTVARAFRLAGRATVRSAVLGLNAALLLVAGTAMFLYALDVLAAHRLIEPAQHSAPDWAVVLPVKLMTQTLGAALLGLGVLVLTAAFRARRGAGVGAGPGQAPGALAGAHLFLAVAFAVNLVQYRSALGWVTVSVTSAFAVAYTVLWLADVLRKARPRQRPGDPSGRPVAAGAR